MSRSDEQMDLDVQTLAAIRQLRDQYNNNQIGKVEFIMGVLDALKNDVLPPNDPAAA